MARLADRRSAIRAAVALLCAGGGVLLVGRAAERPALAAGTARICLEARSGKLTPPVAICKTPDAFGGAGIEVAEGANPHVKDGEEPPKLSGDCTLKFKAPEEGTYAIWTRCWWMDGCGNSFALLVDGGSKATVSDGQYKRWHWVRGPKVRLTAGVHELQIHNTEDGARMDLIFLTTDVARVPVGQEKPTPAALVK